MPNGPASHNYSTHVRLVEGSSELAADPQTADMAAGMMLVVGDAGVEDVVAVGKVAQDTAAEHTAEADTEEVETTVGDTAALSIAVESTAAQLDVVAVDTGADIHTVQAVDIAVAAEHTEAADSAAANGLPLLVECCE